MIARPLLLALTISFTSLLLGSGHLLADDFLPSVAPGKVVVRTIPAYPAIEAEVEGSVEKEWDKGFRQDARYVASINNELRWPVVVTYPDWINQAPQPTTRMLIHLILTSKRNSRFPRKKDSR